MSDGEKQEEQCKRFRMRTKRSVRPILTVFRPKIKESLSRDQFRLYQLIWKRFCRKPYGKRKDETTTVNIAAGDYTFRVSTSKVAFDGFMLAYTEADDEKGKTGTFKNQLIKIQN